MLGFKKYFRTFNPKLHRVFLLGGIALSFLCIACTGACLAAPGLPAGKQAFLDLSNDGVVMNLSAHPDDEDGSTLAYYRMRYGVKTYTVLFTRGEGGQNEIGPELYEELGVLRTAETEAAGKILGAQVRFLNFYDFGYSKTATETFAKWGGTQEVLRRLVYVIRKYKPDILFTNHNTVDGHGHHQAVAITAIAAFDAAADSTMFPEQLRLPGVALWQPRKLYFRVFRTDTQRPDVVHAIGDTNAAMQRSYLDVAAEAIGMHKSQGLDGSRLRAFTGGKSAYRLVRTNSMYARDTTDFFGGIDLWNDTSLSVLRPLRVRLDALHEGIPLDSLLAIASFIQRELDRLSPDALSPLAQRIVRHWGEELEALLRLSLRVSASWTLSDTLVVPRQRVQGTLTLHVPDHPITEFKASYALPQGWAVNELEHVPLAPGSTRLTRSYELIVADDAVFTYPKTVAQYRPIESEQDVALVVRFTVRGKPVHLTVRPIFDVAPYQILNVTPTVARISPADADKGRKFSFELRNLAPRKTAGRIVVQMPKGWLSETATFAIAEENGVSTGALLVRPPKDVKPGEYKLRFKSEYAWSDVTVRVFDLAVDRTITLGIIKSYDNTFEEAARELGLNFKLLTARDLEGNLSSYKTLLVDIRAYMVREDLKKNNQRLLEYIRNGGHVVVMYQKDQDWKPEYAPFSFQVGRKRISVEEAPVTVLVPDHPLFTSPNKITEEDWQGWVQERGVYFPENVAPEYTQLLSSHDPDEPPLTTGYLVAHYGKGSYIYTSYVWYRQLKEYHPGAYRCFVNMISYPNVRETSARQTH